MITGSKPSPCPLPIDGRLEVQEGVHAATSQAYKQAKETTETGLQGAGEQGPSDNGQVVGSVASGPFSVRGLSLVIDIGAVRRSCASPSLGFAPFPHIFFLDTSPRRLCSFNT